MTNCIDIYAYFMHTLIMRTTINIDDKILSQAEKLTGIHEKTSLVRLGLQALIAKEAAHRLAALGGTEKKLKSVKRKRF